MFGDVVRNHRLGRGLSQEDLATAAMLTDRSVRNIESGRTQPRPATVRALAHAFGFATAEREAFIQAASVQGTARDASAAALASATPAQLPPDLPGFTGRTALLRHLSELRATGVSAGSPVTAVLRGPAGMGKTTLAIHWSHSAARNFPDGQVYADLRGFRPGHAAEPADVLASILESFGVPRALIPTGLAGRAAMYRSALAGKRMLILIDDARHVSHVRPLLPGAAGCMTVVTSRNPLTSLIAARGAIPVRVGALSSEEAREFLVRRVGQQRLDTDRAAVDTIVGRCAGLPLALAMVAARAAVYPELPLATLAARLTDRAGSFDLAGRFDLAYDEQQWPDSHAYGS